MADETCIQCGVRPVEVAGDTYCEVWPRCSPDDRTGLPQLGGGVETEMAGGWDGLSFGFNTAFTVTTVSIDQLREAFDWLAETIDAAPRAPRISGSVVYSDSMTIHRFDGERWVEVPEVEGAEISFTGIDFTRMRDDGDGIEITGLIGHPGIIEYVPLEQRIREMGLSIQLNTDPISIRAIGEF